ncbi:hypothetical protein A2870_03475 [Candidatus Curtissbacteria bacterium RIFCSPHIGHO2_01_FULL_41_11]|uniref:Uncharacterized protein n=1 Tax=Candidatus Curtissbacteria bacterium RIFCSPHIGHO2_01_FULL_41_11 TaxID=1797711 RepID=A0A1F5G5M9_9BACT|nr:MAG: hypothetical protein A2870_03475 [Candidatus Curtissbacteria bacterium RIFCSPHIGHO2_01_FULL_41_11]
MTHEHNSEGVDHAAANSQPAKTKLPEIPGEYLITSWGRYIRIIPEPPKPDLNSNEELALQEDSLGNVEI